MLGMLDAPDARGVLDDLGMLDVVHAARVEPDWLVQLSLKKRSRQLECHFTIMTSWG